MVDVQQTATTRIGKFVQMLPKMNTVQVNVEFQGIRNLLSFAPDACVPIVEYMRSMIEHGGNAWQDTTNVARGLVEKAPELHAYMRERWRDALLFHILTNNADDTMRQLAGELDLASSAPDQGSLGVARAMTAETPRPLFIIGAGFSYDSMPLTQELEALVTGILAGTGIEDPVQLLRNDWKVAWQHIAKDPEKFKQRFVGFSTGRKPATQHRVLSAALSAKTVAGVISFNWDNHVERAGHDFEVVNSEEQEIDQPGLWKMHGDVDAPDRDWVWPQEDGRPLRNVCEYVLGQAHDGHISHVVVVGYAEREQNIHTALLKPLQKSCPNWLRVRPTGQGGPEGHFAKTAKQFLGEIDSFQRAVSQGLI